MPATETEPRTITRQELAKKLNEDLAREYQAIIAYVVYSQALKGAQYMSVAKELEIHAGEELQHAIAIAKQIDYLGEMPTGSALPVVLSEDAETMLRADLENENADHPQLPRAGATVRGAGRVRSRRGDSRDPQAGAGSPDRAGDGPRRGRARRVEGRKPLAVPPRHASASRASRPPRPDGVDSSTSAGSGGYFDATYGDDRGDVVGVSLATIVFISSMPGPRRVPCWMSKSWRAGSSAIGRRSAAPRRRPSDRARGTPCTAWSSPWMISLSTIVAPPSVTRRLPRARLPARHVGDETGAGIAHRFGARFVLGHLDDPAGDRLGVRRLRAARNRLPTMRVLGTMAVSITLTRGFHWTAAKYSADWTISSSVIALASSIIVLVFGLRGSALRRSPSRKSRSCWMKYAGGKAAVGAFSGRPSPFGRWQKPQPRRAGPALRRAQPDDVGHRPGGPAVTSQPRCCRRGCRPARTKAGAVRQLARSRLLRGILGRRRTRLSETPEGPAAPRRWWRSVARSFRRPTAVSSPPSCRRLAAAQRDSRVRAAPRRAFRAPPQAPARPAPCRTPRAVT